MDTNDNSNPEYSSFLEELYVARCKDTLEQPSREEFLRFSSRLKPRISGPTCSLRNQHLGVSAANTLSKFFRNRTDLQKLDLYCNLIRDHGLQVVTHFVQLNKYIRIFNIGCNDLSDKSAPQLANIVLSNHITSLQLGIMEKSLHPNKFSSITIDALADAIVKTGSLQALGLNGASLGLKPSINVPSAESALIRILARSNSLMHLSLSNCEINSNSMLEIIDKGLCYNSSLRRLDISKNNLSQDVGSRLVNYFLNHTKKIVPLPDADDPETEFDTKSTNRPPRLFYLDASWNCFSPLAEAEFSTVLSQSQYLGYLDLSGNGLGDDGTKKLSNALAHNETLVELHLSSNNITSIGGIAIAEALKVNCVLTTLNISKNKLGDETAKAIADALSNNSSISALNISSSMLSNDGGIQIAKASQKCPTLVSLDMSDNFFTEDAGTAMEKTFRENISILKINVSGTQINHFSFHALNEICSRNAAMLKQKEQKPLRNQFIKSQYAVVELQRKEAILQQLINQKNDLQSQIDSINDIIRTHKGDEETASSLLTKQIQEKELQMVTEQVEFKGKKQKLDEELKMYEDKKLEVMNALEAQLKTNQEIRTKIDERKAVLQSMTEEFETIKANKLKEIEALTKAADELMELSKNSEALAQLEELPKFISFGEEAKVSATPSNVQIKEVSSRSTKSKKAADPKKKRKPSPK